MTVGIYTLSLFFYNIHMAADFRTPDRDQIFLMPPRLEEWIQEDDKDELKGDLKRLTTLKEKVKKAQEKLEGQERTEPDNQVNMTDSENRIMRENMTFVPGNHLRREQKTLCHG
jgi:hypothetical protein